jgi:concanavalin A-like lectin/glucanase superfamily protein
VNIVTFEQLQQKPKSQKVVLCEIEPFVHLDSWSETDLIVDSSATARTVTNNTAVTINTTTKKLGAGSGYFASGHNLSCADSDDWDFGTGPFTIHVFARLSSLAAQQGIIGQWDSISNYWSLQYYPGIGFVFAAENYTSGLTVVAYDPAGGPAWSADAINTWYHLAVVRNGSTFTIYRDGVAGNGPTTSALAMPALSAVLEIGVLETTVMPFTGYLDEAVINKGTALWTTAFTPPTVPPSPTTNTKLLLHFTPVMYKASFPEKAYSDKTVTKVREDFNTLYVSKETQAAARERPGSFYYDSDEEMLYIHTTGSDNPSNYTICAYFRMYLANTTKPPLDVSGLFNSKFLLDSSGVDHSVAKNDVFFDNEQAHFGGGSAKFYPNTYLTDNTEGKYLDMPISPEFEFGTAAFTIEMFVRLGSVANAGFCLMIQPYATGEDTDMFYLYFSTADGLKFYAKNAGATTVTITEGNSTSWAADTWTHIAIVRDGSNNWGLFRNGTRIGTSSSTMTMPDDFTRGMVIGSWPVTATEYDANMYGNIDEVRISAGIARYTPTSSTLTVPTAAFTTDLYTKLLLHFEGASFPKYYHPKIISAPICERKTGSMDEPGGDSWTIGNLVLDNGAGTDGTGKFDAWFYDVVWFGAEVRVIIGGENLPYGEYELSGIFYIQAAEKNFEEISFDLTDVREFLKTELPLNVFSADDTGYTNLEEGKEGASKPLMYGLVRKFVPTLIDSTTLEYQCCDHRFLFVQAYDMSDDSDVGAVPVGFTIDNDNGKFTLKATPVGQLVVDAVGLVGENLVDNGTFEDWILPDPYIEYEFDDWTTSNTGSPTNTVTPVTGSTQKVTGSYGLKLHKAHATDYDVTVRQAPGSIRDNRWWRVVFYVKGSTTGGSGDADGFNIEVKNGSYYLQDDLVSWTTSQNYLTAAKLPVSGASDMMGVTFVFNTADSNFDRGYATYFTLGLFVGSGDGDVYVDGFEVSAAHEHAGTIARDICKNHLALGEDVYDNQAMLAIDDDRPYCMGFIVDKKLAVEQILKKINIATFSRYQITRGGKLQLLAWSGPTGTPTPVKHDRFTFLSMKERIELKSLRWKISIGWGHLVAEGKWNYETAEDEDVKNIFKITEEETVDSVLSDQSGAAAIAALYLAMLKAIRNNITKRSKLRPLKSDLNDTIELTKARFHKGAATNLEIVSIKEDWNNNETILELFHLL